jgi:hypothetical protein
VTLCLFENGESHYCVIALKNHLLALKKIGSSDTEVLIQTSEAIVALKALHQRIISVGRNGSLVIYRIEAGTLKVLESVKICNGTINMCAIHNEEALAMSLDDDSLHLYMTGNRIALGNFGKLSDFIFGSDNQLIVTTTTGVLHVVDINSAL